MQKIVELFSLVSTYGVFAIIGGVARFVALYAINKLERKEVIKEALILMFIAIPVGTIVGWVVEGFSTTSIAHAAAATSGIASLNIVKAVLTLNVNDLIKNLSR